MSLASRAAKAVAKKSAPVAKRAADKEMSKLDNFLASIGNPDEITEAQLRKWERMIPGLNAVERKRGTEFLGLSPDAKFPNKRILQRAGLMEPDVYGPEAPLGRFPESPLGRFPESPAGQFPDPREGRLAASANAFGSQVVPPKHGQLADAFASQMAPNKVPALTRTGRIGGMMARNPGKTALGIGAAGLGGMMMMPSHGETQSPELEPQDYGLYDDTKFDPTKLAPASPMSKAVNRHRARPKPSALSGVNGLPDMGHLGGMDFGAETPNFEEMFRQDFEKPIPQFEEEKKSGGKMDWLKTIGPLIAALMAGRMMK